MRFLFMIFAYLNVRMYIIVMILYIIRTTKGIILASKRH